MGPSEQSTTYHQKAGMRQRIGRKLRLWRMYRTMPQALSYRTYFVRGSRVVTLCTNMATCVGDSVANISRMADICKHGATAARMPAVFRPQNVSGTPFLSSLLHVLVSAVVLVVARFLKGPSSYARI